MLTTGFLQAEKLGESMSSGQQNRSSTSNRSEINENIGRGEIKATLAYRDRI